MGVVIIEYEQVDGARVVTLGVCQKGEFKKKKSTNKESLEVTHKINFGTTNKESLEFKKNHGGTCALDSFLKKWIFCVLPPNQQLLWT